MELVSAQGRALLVEVDGSINAPLSIYLNDRFDNPHTREAVSVSLRIFNRFLLIHRIDLAARSLDGECLRAVECDWLAELAYLPLEQIEQMSDAMLKRITTIKKDASAIDRKGGVGPDTAAARLNWVADFLKWYWEKLLAEAVRSSATRVQLETRYAATRASLATKIARTPQGHHHNVRSLPNERYLQVIREIVVNPERLFTTDGGKPSSTLMRDRAIALLAAEGIRPGAIGNITIEDFRYREGDTHGYVEIKDNVAKRGTPLTTAVPKAKGTRSTKQRYNSTITVRLWPFTCLAIKEYVDGARAGTLSRRLANRSKSFLFLGEHGGPIADRTTIALIFSRMEARLKAAGLLDTARDDPFARGSHYEFSAYTMRHSGATLFYAANAHKPNVEDLMRERFGWTAKSTSPSRYAKRAMSEAANVNMTEFHEMLLQARAVKRAEGRQD